MSWAACAAVERPRAPLVRHPPDCRCARCPLTPPPSAPCPQRCSRSRPSTSAWPNRAPRGALSWTTARASRCALAPHEDGDGGHRCGVPRHQRGVARALRRHPDQDGEPGLPLPTPSKHCFACPKLHAMPHCRSCCAFVRTPPHVAVHLVPHRLMLLAARSAPRRAGGLPPSSAHLQWRVLQLALGCGPDLAHNCACCILRCQ